MEIKTIVTIVLIAFIVGGLVWLQIKKRKDKK
jgi:hypothetical protein